MKDTWQVVESIDDFVDCLDSVYNGLPKKKMVGSY